MNFKWDLKKHIDDKRKEECKKKGKECNPETGRCIIPKKSN